MSNLSGSKVALAILVGVAALAVVLVGYREPIRTALEKLWQVREVREFSHDALDTVDPLTMGPTIEVKAGWTFTEPDLDGVLDEGEWDQAAMVGFDGADRIRPGVASSHKDSIRDRGRSGLIPHTSNHAVLYLMNDEIRMYVAIDVTDDVLDFGEGDVAKRDSVEIALCDAGLQTERLHGKPRHFFLFLGDGRVFVGGLPGGEYAATVKPDFSGYVVELAFKPPSEDDVIGFDIGINDSDDPANEDGSNQYFWNGTHDSLLSEGRECGRVYLSTIGDEG